MHETPLDPGVPGAAARGDEPGPPEDLDAEAARMLRKIGWDPTRLVQIRIYAQMPPAQKIAIMLRFRNGQVAALRERVRREHPDLSPTELAWAVRRRLDRAGQ